MPRRRCGGGGADMAAGEGDDRMTVKCFRGCRRWILCRHDLKLKLYGEVAVDVDDVRAKRRLGRRAWLVWDFKTILACTELVVGAGGVANGEGRRDRVERERAAGGQAVEGRRRTRFATCPRLHRGRAQGKMGAV